MYSLICLCRPSSLGPEVKETLFARLGPCANRIALIAQVIFIGYLAVANV